MDKRKGTHNRFSLKFVFLLFSFFLLTFSAIAQDGTDSPAYKQGEAIFKGQCASCHKVNAKLVGPALAGVEEKYDREWLYKWIKNSQELVKAGDPQAVAIFEEYNQSVMPAMPLADEEIDAVLEYIKVGPTKTQDAGGAGGAGAADEAGFTPTKIFLALISLILLTILFMLSRVVGKLDRQVRKSRGEDVPEPVSLFKNRKVIAASSLMLFALMGYGTFDQAAGLGRQINYQPDQPIKFSHALHAGKHKIDCQYCHSGAYKGKSAVIPSTNVCMNCHKAIQEGPNYGKEEISKIYASAGWNPSTQKYEGEEEPIEWVRIHNLPDHVYFSHAQHVNAGGIECQECHGPIEEMEVVQQHSLLSMGWCINCHRETQVQFTSNDYYGVYEDLHKGLKDGTLKKVTVEDIGGLECQKCHY